MATNGCLGCKDRKVGCHSSCKRYLKWKQEHDKDTKLKKDNDKKYSNYFYHK